MSDQMYEHPSDQTRDPDAFGVGPFIAEPQIDEMPLGVVPAEYPHLPISPPQISAWQADTPDVGEDAGVEAHKSEARAPLASSPRANRATLPLAAVDPGAEPASVPITQPLPTLPPRAQTLDRVSDGAGGSVDHQGQAVPTGRRRPSSEERSRPHVSVLGFVVSVPRALGCAALLMVLVLCGLGTLLSGLPWLHQHGLQRNQYSAGRSVMATPTALTVTASGTANATASPLPTSLPTSGGGTLQSTPTPTFVPGAPTPTTALPTATPNPHAISATVTFTRTTAIKNSDPSMTACPSGCPLGAKAIKGSQSFAPAFGTTGWNQTSIEGYIQVNNISQHAIIGVVAPFAVLSGGIRLYCQNGAYDNGAGFYVSVPYAGTVTVDCVVTSTSTSPPPANYFVNPTALDNGIPVEIDQTSAFWSNGYQVLTQADCDNAVTQARNSAVTWADNDWNNQLIGWTAVSAPAVWTSNEYCTPQVWTAANTVTGYSTGNESGLGWHPSDAVALARARLNAQLDGHYVWTGQSTCTPAVGGVSGTTISVTCGESGTEQYQWTTANTSALQAKLADLSLADAQTLCQTTVGVSGGCTFSLQGGTMFPINPAMITITPQ